MWGFTCLEFVIAQHSLVGDIKLLEELDGLFVIEFQPVVHLADELPEPGWVRLDGLGVFSQFGLK